LEVKIRVRERTNRIVRNKNRYINKEIEEI